MGKIIEIWKDVKDFEGLYQVSNLGRVRKKDLILKERDNGKGYKIIGLYKGKSTKKYIHRLVAEAFIPNLENKPQVNHIDGNKSNNNLNNLEWCTLKENQQHALKLKLRKEFKGSKNIMSKLTECQVNFIKRKYKFRDETWNSYTLAKLFNVSYSTILYIVRGKTWQNI